MSLGVTSSLNLNLDLLHYLVDRHLLVVKTTMMTIMMIMMMEGDLDIGQYNDKQVNDIYLGQKG